MPYKLIDRLEKLTGRVSGAALTHRDLISESLAEMFRDRLRPGQKYPDVHQLHTFISEDLEKSHYEVVTSERTLKANLTEERRGRAVRDNTGAAVREHLFAARNIFDGIFGPDGKDIIFMEFNSWVRFDPVPLHRQGWLVHDNLLDPGFRLPELRRDVGVDLRKIAREMEDDLKALGEKIRWLRRQDTIQSVAKKEAVMEHEESRTSVSVRLLEAFAAFAGHPGIARRIRLSSHQAKKNLPLAAEALPPPDGEAEDADEADEPSGDEPSTEPPAPAPAAGEGEV